MLELLGSKVLARGDGAKVAAAGDVYTFLVTGAETGGRWAAWVAHVPPGGGPPPHKHTREDEAFLVLDGELTLNVAGTEVVLRPGDFANAARGTRHFFRNNTAAPVRAVLVVSPAGLEEMFRETGRPVGSEADAAPPTPEELDKLKKVAPRYGIELFPPAS